MRAFRLGRSAISSAERARAASRSFCALRKVSTELARSLPRSRRTWFSTVRWTISRETAVNPAEVSSMAIKNLVRNRTRPIANLPPGLSDKFVARSVDSTEMYWIGGVFFQFLPQAKNVGVDGACGWVVVVAPDFIKQFGPRNHPLLVAEEEAQHLEFLRS